MTSLDFSEIPHNDVCNVCNVVVTRSYYERESHWQTHFQSVKHRQLQDKNPGRQAFDRLATVMCTTCNVSFKFSSESSNDWQNKLHSHLSSRAHSEMSLHAGGGGSPVGEETCIECSGVVRYPLSNSLQSRINNWSQHRASRRHTGGGAPHDYSYQAQTPQKQSPQRTTRRAVDIEPATTPSSYFSAAVSYVYRTPTTPISESRVIQCIQAAYDFARKHRHAGQYEVFTGWKALAPSSVLSADLEALLENNPYRRAIFARDDVVNFVHQHTSLVLNELEVLEIRSVPRGQTVRASRALHRRQFVEAASRGQKRETRGTLPYAVELPRCPLPMVLAEVVSYTETEKRCELILRSTTYAFEPTAHLHNLLYCEEACVKASLREYDLEGVSFTRGTVNLLRLRVPGLAEKRPSVLIDDVIEAIDTTTSQCHVGYVHYVHHDEIDVHFSSAVVMGKLYDVHFTCKRTAFRSLHRAVDRVQELGRPLLKLQHTLPHPDSGTDLFNAEALAQLNIAQRAFIEKVCTTRAGLSVLWGPPGTGKTTTVVAYIASIATCSQPLPKGLKILVATPSNGASNLIVSKLRKFLPDETILRVMALSRDQEEVPEDVRRCCRTIEFIDEHGRSVTRFRSPHADEVQHATVIVSTLGSCGSLYGIHPSTYFSHVIVDECGQATEPEFASALQFDGLQRVVIAGDPKQLGPIVMSMAAQRKGLSCSPLVRLIEQEQCATTMLNECYRCHPEVLSAFNPVFYDSKLVPAAFGGVKFTTGPIPGFSKERVHFIHCSKPESYDRKSPSVMNLHEIDIVVEQFDRLRTAGVQLHDIVVLAPYALQVKKAREMLRLSRPELHLAANASWLKTHVCSIEAFQGRESKIVILSCVRSPEELEHTANSKDVAEDVRRSLGFLSQPQRSNVALSRAIDGLIVVGNLKLLWKDFRVWRPVLNCLLAAGAYFVVCAQDRNIIFDERPFDELPSVDDGTQCDADEADTTQYGIPRLEE